MSMEDWPEGGDRTKKAERGMLGVLSGDSGACGFERAKSCRWCGGERDEVGRVERVRLSKKGGGRTRVREGQK